MPDKFARPPVFGGKLMTDEYYSHVSAVISTLRPLATLRVIAEHLNSQGLLSPRGLSWDRQRVANFLRSAQS